MHLQNETNERPIVSNDWVHLRFWAIYSLIATACGVGILVVESVEEEIATTTNFLHQLASNGWDREYRRKFQVRQV